MLRNSMAPTFSVIEVQHISVGSSCNRKSITRELAERHFDLAEDCERADREGWGDVTGRWDSGKAGAHFL